MKRIAVVSTLMIAVASAIAFSQAASNPTAGRNWSSPLGDPGSTLYSTLNQITPANVKNLERAWTFHTGSDRFAYPPMIVDSVMYFSAPNGVFAVDAVTGKQIWKYAGDAPPAAPPAPTPAAAAAAAGNAEGAPAGGGRGGGGAGGAGMALMAGAAGGADGAGGAGGAGGGGHWPFTVDSHW